MLLENLIEKIYKLELNAIAIYEKYNPLGTTILNHYKEVLIENGFKIKSVIETTDFWIELNIVPAEKGEIKGIERIKEELIINYAKLINPFSSFGDKIVIKYEYDEQEYSHELHRLFHQYNSVYKELYKYVNADLHTKLKVLPSFYLYTDYIPDIKIQDAEGFEEEVKNIKKSFFDNLNSFPFYIDLSEEKIRVGIKGNEIRFTYKNFRISLNGKILFKLIESKEEFSLLLKKIKAVSEIYENQHLYCYEEVDESLKKRVVMVEEYIEMVKNESFSTLKKYFTELESVNIAIQENHIS